MKIDTKATILTAESKPYNVEGNEGISHRIRVNVAGEIYPIKSTKEQVTELSERIGEEGEAVIKVNSRKENLSLELVSFE